MSDQDEPVLSEDEKSALLEGVASGAIEVASASGPQYARVSPYVIGPRARIVTNGLPRLAAMNEQFAARFAGACGDLLQADADVVAGPIRVRPFAEIRDLWPARSVVVRFTAAPLPGEALAVVDPVLIGPLVEAFFGGNSPDSSAIGAAAHSAGALRTVKLLVAEALGIVAEVWTPLASLKPASVATQVGLDVVEAIGESDGVVACEFELALGGNGGERGSFALLWPEAMIAGLRAGLEGRRRDRDPAEDTRWAKALRQRMPEVMVPLATTVGRARMTLGQVVNLKPGDVIGIDAPRVATLLAAGVPLLEGRFGVQAGRNAIETVSWLDPKSGR